MSATRTFTVLKASAFISGDDWTYTVGDNCRQALDLLAYNAGHYDLGGSLDVAVMSASYVPVIGYREFTIDGDTLGGLTLDVVVFSQPTNASGSVTLRVRNTTDSTTAATSTANTTTGSVTKETVSVTLASGPKVYRLEIIGGSASYPVFGYGYLRFRKVAA